MCGFCRIRLLGRWLRYTRGRGMVRCYGMTSGHVPVHVFGSVNGSVRERSRRRTTPPDRHTQAPAASPKTC